MAQSDAVGVPRILELVRGLGMSDHVRNYQASTSELYGDTPAVRCREAVRVLICQS
jgi:GDP-D-mannose dehydratase